MKFAVIASLVAVLFIPLAFAQPKIACDDAISGTVSGPIAIREQRTDGTHVFAVGKRSGWVHLTTTILVDGKSVTPRELRSFAGQTAKVEFAGWTENKRCFIDKMKPVTRFGSLVITITKL